MHRDLTPDEVELLRDVVIYGRRTVVIGATALTKDTRDLPVLNQLVLNGLVEVDTFGAGIRRDIRPVYRATERGLAYLETHDELAGAARWATEERYYDEALF